MQRIAFKMKLFAGQGEEYKKRHEALWDELKELLKQTGISNYSIFLDKQTNDLFAYLTIGDEAKLDQLPNEPVMKRWWDSMKDIMETNQDNSPLVIPMEEVFYLA